jgi:hypothetical protein
MADIPLSSETMLYPGDLVDLTYEITSTNETLVALAVHDLKQTLYADARFDYQGSREITASNVETQQPVRFLIITLLVRKTLRQEHVPIQEANLGPVALVAIVALAAAAVIAYSGAVVYRSVQVRRAAEAQAATTEAILADPTLTAAEKAAAIEAATPAAPTGIGAGLAGLGSGVFVAAILLGAIWLMTGSDRRSHREY